ncbi:Zinc finger protein [Trichinella spiralis]|uniref:Zinc finger protein n=1 Tax=Trichinella spiralis TaxID=6334 RepID=A0ABR3KCA5_TRISP
MECVIEFDLHGITFALFIIVKYAVKLSYIKIRMNADQLFVLGIALLVFWLLAMLIIARNQILGCLIERCCPGKYQQTENNTVRLVTIHRNTIDAKNDSPR